MLHSPGSGVTQWKLEPQWPSLTQAILSLEEKLFGADTGCLTLLGFTELQGFLKHGTFSAKTRSVLDKLGQIGHPGTQRKRPKKFPGFFFLSSFLFCSRQSHPPLVGPSGKSFWETSCRGQTSCHTEQSRQKAKNDLEGQQT